MVLDSGQVNSLDGERENRNVMVFTKPLNQASGDICWPCLMTDTMPNESDLQSYL